MSPEKNPVGGCLNNQYGGTVEVERIVMDAWENKSVGFLIKFFKVINYFYFRKIFCNLNIFYVTLIVCF